MKDKKDFRLIYMGTPAISAKTFEALINKGWNFIGLIAQEDKLVGRKKKLEEVPTKVVAKKYNIPVYQPHKIRLDYEFVKELKPDLILTFAYGQIIPLGLLDIPNKHCLNLHGSILPKYRGAAPIQRAIMNNEKETGISLMYMIDKMDAGNVLAIEKVFINPEDNYTSLCDKMSDAAINVVEKHLLNYLNQENVIGEMQDESKVSFANKIAPEEEHISLEKTCLEQVNHIRALSYSPGAFYLLDNLKFKVYKAKIYSNEIKDKIGVILFLDNHLLLQAKDGLIELLEVQLQGKNKMTARDFVNGHKDIINKQFK